MEYLKIFRVARANLLRIPELGDFILYSERNEQLGAMRQKMAIFEEGSSVCRVHFFQELSFCRARDFFAGAKIATHLRIRVLNVKTRILTNLLISSSFLGDGESEILCAFLPVSPLFFLLVLLLPAGSLVQSAASAVRTTQPPGPS